MQTTNQQNSKTRVYSWTISLLLTAGILLLIIGCAAWLNPWHIFIRLLKGLGYAWIASGTFLLFHALLNSTGLKESKWLQAESCTDLLFGILFVLNPLLSAAIFPLLVGCWMIARGLLKILMSKILKQVITGWKIILTMGIFSTVCGLLVTCYPFKKFSDMTSVMSLFAIILGIFYLYDAVRFWKREDTLLAIV